ncbi:hypothetical protein N2152v2_005509 [Parachlorella kessleri]
MAQLQQVAIVQALLLFLHLPCQLAALQPCPAATSVFDLPDIHSCRSSLQAVRQHEPCPPRPRPSPCCEPAAAFLAAGCHCWRGFDRGEVARLQALVEECRQGSHLGGTSSDSGSSSSLEAASAVLSTLSPNQGAAGQQQPLQPGQQEQGQGQGDLAGGLRLFVGILSSSSHRDRRDAIRETWGRHPLLHRARFFLARSPNETLFDEVRREAVEAGDLVVLPLVREHYHNITHQTLEAVRMAAADPATTHVLKVDDDSYVHVDRLLGELASLPRQRLYWGFMEDPGGSPHRNPSSQWYVAPEEWPSERYPPWAHGAGYVLSADLAREIAAGAAVKPLPDRDRLFKLEDVSVGSWVEWVETESRQPVNRVREPRFNFNKCSPRDLVSHYISPQQQRCIWEAHGRTCHCRTRLYPRAGSRQQQQRARRLMHRQPR